MLTHGKNLIFFLVYGSTTGEMARHSVLNTLHAPEGALTPNAVMFTSPRDPCTKQACYLDRVPETATAHDADTGLLQA